MKRFLNSALRAENNKQEEEDQQRQSVFQCDWTQNYVFSTFGFASLLQGKGVPDVNTRLMLRKLHDILRVAVFALVDGDPHGKILVLVFSFGFGKF